MHRNLNLKCGVAELQEFLQQKYVENYETEEINDEKVYGLIDAYPEFFYLPKKNGFGLLDYIEYDGKALYFINKSGLPKEIRESLTGGDAGENDLNRTEKYLAYVSCNDVYGITKDLKVYYCKDGLDSIEYLAKDDLDKALERTIYNTNELGNNGANSLESALSGYDGNQDGKITSSEVGAINKLKITSKTDLRYIYNLYSLEQLIIKGTSDINLDGIENCLNSNLIVNGIEAFTNKTSIKNIRNKLNVTPSWQELQTDS